MAGSLVCTTVHEPSLAVVRANGHLSLWTAIHLRTALLKCLAEQPTAILVDAAGLTVEEDMSLTALTAAARHAAAWPAVPLLVCGPSEEVRAALCRLGADRYVNLCDGLDHGRVVAARRELPTQVRERFAAVAGSVTAARELVTEVCDRWRLPLVADHARVVASELVGNAVRHARTPIELILTRGSRYLHVAVRDHDRRRSRLVGPNGETEPGGRGLLLVEALSSSWGCTLLPEGKVTWASLPLTARRSF